MGGVRPEAPRLVMFLGHPSFLTDTPSRDIVGLLRAFVITLSDMTPRALVV